MVPNIPPQEASNRLQIFQVKLHFCGYIDIPCMFKHEHELWTWNEHEHENELCFISFTIISFTIYT